jgi:hypothetical protein
VIELQQHVKQWVQTCRRPGSSVLQLGCGQLPRLLAAGPVARSPPLGPSCWRGAAGRLLVPPLGSSKALALAPLRLIREAPSRAGPICRKPPLRHPRRRELLAVAPTGSGKTLAFLLPIVAKVKALRHEAGCPQGVKALVVSPTQELAAQQARVLRLLLPGSGCRACLLTKSTAAGSDLGKVRLPSLLAELPVAAVTGRLLPWACLRTASQHGACWSASP